MIVAVLTLGFLYALPAAAWQVAGLQALRPGVPIAGELASGQSHSYEFTLEAGQFTVITAARQHGAPVLSVTDPSGRPIIERAFRQVSVVATATGRHVLRVGSNEASGAPGRYELRIEAPRPAGQREIATASGDRALSEGQSLMLPRSATANQQAIDKLQEAIEFFDQAEYRWGRALALLKLGQVHVRSSTQTVRARSYFNDAIELARSIDDDAIEADALLGLGTAYPALTERKRALEYYDRARERYEALGDQGGQAVALSNAGNAWNDLQENRTAQDYFNRALPLASGVGDHATVARIHNSLGIAHQELGDIPGALDQFTRSLPLSRSTGDLQLEYMVLNNTGIAYKLLGDYRRALASYQQSLLLARKLGNVLSEAQLLNNIGNIYKAEVSYERSLETFEQSLSMFRRLKAQAGEAMVLNNMGAAYYQLREYQKALDLHLQSHEIRKAAGDRRGDSSSLNNAGLAWHKLSEPGKALECLREALEIRRQTSDPFGEAETLLNIAIVERDTGNLADARMTLEAALAITEGLRAKIADSALRASYIGRVQDTYASYVDVLMRLHAQSPSAGYDVAALQAAERTRARVLLESLVEAREDISEGADPALLDSERSLQRKIDAGLVRLSRSLSGTSTAAQAAAARKELEGLTAEHQQVQAQLRASSPRYAALTQPEPLTAARIQQEVLDDETVLLEFALGEEQSWLWAVTPDAVRSVPLPARRDLEAAARSLYAELTARQPRSGEAPAAYAKRVAAADRHLRDRSAAVSRMLFAGVTDQLHGPWRGKRLVIVATGALEYLPFGSLPLPPRASGEAGQPSVPLVARHEIVEAPSASVLATLRRESAARQPAPRAVAVLADPVFEATDPRIAAMPRSGPTDPAASRSGRASAATPAAPSQGAVRTVDRIEEVRGGAALARLPFSRDEADAIAGLAGRAALRATDFRASRATALNGSLVNYRIVHFATHGLIDAQQPELSGLVFSLVNERGQPQDGLLRLRDIYNLRLQADLVVLSACQTALGKEIRGEGLVGLTRGFMYAGAPRVVASLWQVSDVATAELMKKFYKGMLQRQLPAAAALRAAQLEMARDPRWAAPYYWAGFVLQGDWK